MRNHIFFVSGPWRHCKLPSPTAKGQEGTKGALSVSQGSWSVPDCAILCLPPMQEVVPTE